jgi:hypothetical protein
MTETPQSSGLVLRFAEQLIGQPRLQARVVESVEVWIAGLEPIEDTLVVVVDDEETQAIDLLDAANDDDARTDGVTATTAERIRDYDEGEDRKPMVGRDASDKVGNSLRATRRFPLTLR